MRTDIPEKLLRIASDIEQKGPQNITRLTVLKRWFSDSKRLASFAIFIAKRASGRKGKSKGEAATLFKEARDLLKNAKDFEPRISVEKAKEIYYKLSNYQNEYKKLKWNLVRIIENQNLYLVEEGLRIYLWDQNNPYAGYRLAADYCEHYNPRNYNSLDEKSIYKIEEIVRFMFTYEGLTDLS